MIRNSYGLWAVLFLLSAAPVASAPLLVQEDGKLFLAAPSDTPVYVFEVTWPPRVSWPLWTDGPQAAEDLRRAVRPEPFTVESLDEGAHRVLVRTSAVGRDVLRLSGYRVAGPEVSSERKACTEVFVRFHVGQSAAPLEDANFYPNRQCPSGEEIDPSRKLIVEGLDRRHRRLFVAASDDPRWAIHETVDEAGHLRLLRKGRDESAQTYVSFAAPPFGDRLHVLKIWQFDDDGRGVVVATVKLVGEHKP